MVLLGYAAGSHSGIVSVPAAVAVLSVLGAAVYAASHVVWLWLDRRGDAFDMAYGLRPMVPRLYPHEAAVRRLFFSMNPMPLWSVFDRDWYRSLKLPNGTQMMATNAATDTEATTQGSAS